MSVLPGAGWPLYPFALVTLSQLRVGTVPSHGPGSLGKDSVIEARHCRGLLGPWMEADWGAEGKRQKTTVLEFRRFR